MVSWILKKIVGSKNQREVKRLLPLVDRVNEIDLRIAKVLRFGRTRTNVGFDIYNLMNSNPILTYNTAYNPTGNWLVPTSVLQSRFVKISASIDF